MFPKTLQGEHISLRTLSRKDAPDLWEEFKNNADIYDYLSYGPFNKSEFDLFIHNCTKDKTRNFFVIVNKQSRAVGIFSLFNIDQYNQSIEIGSIMFGKSLQRTTGGTESFFLVFQILFEQAGFNRIDWRCDVLNEKSKRAARRLGFVAEGIKREHSKTRYGLRDTAWHSLLKRDWPKIKSLMQSWLQPSNFDDQGKQKSSLKISRDTGNSQVGTPYNALTFYSHELRNPLNVLLGLCSNLSANSATLNENEREDIKLLSENVLKIKSLTQRFLTLSRSQSNVWEPNIAEISLAHLFLRLVKNWEFEASSKKIAITIEEFPDVVFLSDPQLIEIALDNVVNNAIKYTINGAVSISVQIQNKRKIEEKNNLLVEIRDTGVGVRKEDLPKIFAFYERGEIKSNRLFDGMGIGLATVRKVLDHLGGDITVDSELGRGTKVTLRLPIEVVSREPSKAVKSVLDETPSKKFHVGVHPLFLNSNNLINCCGLLGWTADLSKEKIDASEFRLFDLVLVPDDLEISKKVSNLERICKIRPLSGSSSVYELFDLVNSHLVKNKVPLNFLFDHSSFSIRGHQTIPWLAGLSMLVVDDSAANLAVFKQSFSKYGLDIKTANSAEEALEQIKDAQNYFNFFVVDLHMPGKDGFWLINKLVHTSSFSGNSIIFALTGDSSSSAADRAKGVGATEVWVKPYIEQNVVRSCRRKIEEAFNKPIKIFDVFENKFGSSVSDKASVRLRVQQQIKGTEEELDSLLEMLKMEFEESLGVFLEIENSEKIATSQFAKISEACHKIIFSWSIVCSPKHKTLPRKCEVLAQQKNTVELKKALGVLRSCIKLVLNEIKNR